MSRAFPASIAFLALCALPAPAGAATLFPPLIADPREDQARVQFVSSTQDYRYGTDVTDSTSVAGIEAGRRGTLMEADLGRTFRAPEMERMFGIRGPWEKYQLAIPGGVFSSFQRLESQLVNVVDYQYGLALDARWRGGDDAAEGPRGTTVTTRTLLYHRSSHVGDEYVTLGRFGRNQQGIDTSAIFRHPPIKRVEVSYEAVRTIASVEWSPWADAPARARVYGGGEFKVPISRREPHRMRAPAAQVGFEFHSDGRRTDRPPPGWLEPVNRWLGDDALTAGWFLAFDLKAQRPFEFASCDNPDGDGEQWTTRLYSTCPYGEEGAYAGSWHGMLGMRLARAVVGGASGARRGPELFLSLDWYRGYSPFGPFQDQRFRYHPRWYVVPSLTLQLW